MDLKSMRPGRRFIVPVLLLGTLPLGMPAAYAGSNRLEGIDVQGEGDSRTVAHQHQVARRPLRYFRPQ